MLDANNEIVHSDLTAIITGPGARPLPRRHLPAERDRARPRPAVPRVHHHLPRRDQGRPGLPAVLRRPRPRPHAAQRPRRLRHQLRHRRHRRRDPRQPPRRRPDGGLHRVPVRGVLPLRVDGRRPGAWSSTSRPTRRSNAGGEHASRRAAGHEGALPRRSVERLPQLPERPRQVPRLHAGPKEHHIHHLHAHQWLHTPDDDNSSYLDSQAIGPGYSFTTEIAYDGSGNRNRRRATRSSTATSTRTSRRACGRCGASHDVFEAGTALDADGRPRPARARCPTARSPPARRSRRSSPSRPSPWPRCPDGQPFQRAIPFFIPGVAGHRPPHPPLDTVDDGGLPRHVIIGGTFTEVHTRLDFDKDLITAIAQPICPRPARPSSRPR